MRCTVSLRTGCGAEPWCWTGWESHLNDRRRMGGWENAVGKLVKSCSVFCVRVARGVSCVRSCGREMCLQCRGVFRIRVLLLLLLLLRPVARWCPASVFLSIFHLFVFCIFMLLPTRMTKVFPFCHFSSFSNFHFHFLVSIFHCFY